jgi:class 3 adenylate cyclase
MFTDIVGYSALMGKDESDALALLKKNREIHKTCLTENKGKRLKEMGDGILSSFDTISDAVYCAIAIQKTASETKDLEIRIGIHVGEVLVEDGDLFGGGVNIASRIESLAVPGSILISEQVYYEIKNNPEVHTKRVGRFDLKNIETPVEIYAIANSGIAVPSEDDITLKNINVPGRSVKLLITPKIMVIGFAFIAIVILGYILYRINM